MSALALKSNRPSGSSLLLAATGLVWLPQPLAPASRGDPPLAHGFGRGGSTAASVSCRVAAVPPQSGSLLLPARVGARLSQAPARPQLPDTLSGERLAPRRLITRGVQLRGDASGRPTRSLPRFHLLAHHRNTGDLLPRTHRPLHPMFGHGPQAPVQMDPHFLARRRRGQKQGRR